MYVLSLSAYFLISIQEPIDYEDPEQQVIFETAGMYVPTDVSHTKTHYILKGNVELNTIFLQEERRDDTQYEHQKTVS